ncbi:unnamed protein product [Paramecium sonneborni]|uniref:CRAL-TRIO domain-containing protein n=1 Tax=Paramecium sonneborni TaxID=65129 RepID=A0A8S1K5B9_9CILI|nr:unnamed protein product [Paramecium sonneborni]
MFQQRFDYLKLPNQVADNIKLNPINIKSGVGQNAIRNIFKNQDYDQFERQQINSLVQELQRNQKYDPNIHSDSLLLRYLYANKFDIQYSFDQLIQRDAILSQPSYLNLNYEVEALYQKGAIYIEGRTENHIPCIAVSTKLIDDLVLFEKAAVILCKIVEELMFYSGKVESWIVVIQTKDQSAFKMPLDKIFQIIKTLQTCFPNSCQQIYILNSTLSINLLMQQIEDYIDPITLNKIKYLKDKELSILSNQFNPEYLEQSLGGQKILQSYWPPDPNDYIYDIPQQQQQSQKELPIYEEEPQVIFQQPTNNMQYLNQAPQEVEIYSPPPPINNQVYQPIIQQQSPSQPPLTEKKKKCICVKCSRDLDDLASQPPQPKQLVSKPKLLESQPLQQPTISQQQPQQIQEILKSQDLNDTYVPYERKYGSVLNDSYLSQINNGSNQLLQDNTQSNQPQFGGNSFNNNQLQQQQQQIQQNNQKSNKPSFDIPFYDSNSMRGSENQEFKQKLQNSSKVNQEIQANMDDFMIDDKSDYQPKYSNKYSRPYQTSQSSRPSNNNQNFQKLINQPSQNPINQSVLSQVPASNQQPSQQYIPTISYQPQSQQQINYPIKNDLIQQEPVHIQEFDNNLNYSQTYYQPQISNDPKKKYDFSQWDKYNDINDPYPVQSYISKSNNYNNNPYLQTSPYKNNLGNTEDYNHLYDNTGDYKPGEFQPSTYSFTPYDFKYNDQQYQPRIEGTTKSNVAQQQSQLKPGQQACQIF